MKLPPLQSPEHYVGLFVFDFGDHASIGYTAEEIEMLRRNPEFAGGKAYVVRSADTGGRLALEGVGEIDLAAEDAMLFVHRESQAATDSYESLCSLAEGHPAPCPVRIEITRFADRSPAHVVALSYKAHGSHAVSTWLTTVGFDGGDTVSGGADALSLYRTEAAPPTSSQYLKCRMDATSRTEAEVLDRIHEPIQR